MIKTKGKFNTAICYASSLDDTTAAQIRQLCDTAEFSGYKIRIMPDVHAGKGCVIGTTMTISDKIVPGMVGVDIGCGMETAIIDNDSLDLNQLNKCIQRSIPAGFEIRETPHPLSHQIDLQKLRCAKHINHNRAIKSIGTLGGGNHFIEVDKSDSGKLFIVIHSGSRYLGSQVAEYYQTEGYRTLSGNSKSQLNETIARLKSEGKTNEIQNTIEILKNQNSISIPKDLAYVQDQLFDDYIHDMKIVQHYATLNRQAMMDVIFSEISLTAKETFTTIHNYIDTNHMILRKGSVSAQQGEKLLIPINMRDGSLICIGKGNPDWNYSAPHGAGRLMSRSAAYKNLSMEQYANEMAGIFSTCVTPKTLDESPMAYKPIDEIIEQISPTAEIIEKIKPIYNFKAQG